MTSMRSKLAVGAAFVLICIFFNAINHTSPGRPPLLPAQFFHSRDVPPPGGWSHRRDPWVVCLVVTSPQHHEDRARHLGSTWGKSGHPSACPDTIFLTSAPHPDLDQVIISTYARYEDLWGKVLKGFLTVESSRGDWFLKADDDTFIVYSHLCHLLSFLDPTQPLYLGLSLMFPLQQDEDALEYMSGGAGYVLSREAVRRLQDTNVKECRVPGLTSYEDVNMGACMKALGVTAGDTRDSLGRPRFLPYPPWVLLDPSLQYQSKYSWLQRLSKYQFNFGAEYLSDQAVSFHEVREPLHHYLLQYLINEVRLSPAAWPSLQTSFPSHHDQPIPLRTHHP